MADKVSAYYLNKRIEKIIGSGLTAVTETQAAKQSFSQIIYPNDFAKSGYIMTYKESKEYLSKYGKGDPAQKEKNLREWTYDKYKEQLDELYNTYEKRFTYYGELRYKREGYTKVINTYLPDVDAEKLNTFDMIEAFKQAHEIERENARNGKKEDSESFWQNVRKFLNGEDLE